MFARLREDIACILERDPDAKLVVIEGMNHVLKAAPLDPDESDDRRDRS